MAKVRRAQFDSGRSLAGPARMAPDQHYAITAASDSSGLVAAAKEALQIDPPVNAMFERFEEMCRRRGVAIDPTLRPGVLKLLAAELWANAEGLEARPKDLIAVTVYHGNIAALITEEEFASLRDTPGVFTRAGIGYPSDPRGFLRKVPKDVAALATEEEFASLRDTPGVFKHAAVHNSSDPHAFLRKVQEDVTALATEEEFASLRDTPASSNTQQSTTPPTHARS